MHSQLDEERNGKYTYQSNYTAKKPKRHFLWWCAGAQQNILAKYPSDQIKYGGLGAVLLATFLLASISAGFALYSVFNTLFAAIVFALLWGAIIFNFDRFLVSTMRKYGVSGKQQFAIAVPRLLLAFLIGITIARPLELKIFEKEIAVRIQENAQAKALKNDSLLDLEAKAATINSIGEKNRLLARRNAIKDTLHRLQQAYLQEADGSGGSGRRGIESITRLKMDAHSNAAQAYYPEISQIEQNLLYHDSVINGAIQSIERRKKEFRNTLNANIGFLEKNKALANLEDEESSVFWTSLLISILIILIEIAPVLSKLIMAVGPYDVELAKEELLQIAASEDVLLKEKTLIFEHRKSYYEARSSISAATLKKVTEVQRNGTRAMLERWEKGETPMPPVKENLHDVVKTAKELYGVDEADLL